MSENFQSKYMPGERVAFYANENRRFIGIIAAAFPYELDDGLPVVVYRVICETTKLSHFPLEHRIHELEDEIYQHQFNVSEFGSKKGI